MNIPGEQIWIAVMSFVTVILVPAVFNTFGILRQHDRDILRLLTILDERNRHHDDERKAWNAGILRLETAINALTDKLDRLDRERADK
jgi:hypothetical protein